MPIRHSMPSLNALLVLEAAARHRSFTSAAQELRVTQAAISRQVAALEQDLQTPLFVRKHRAIEPTHACMQLATTLSTCFASIADSVDQVRSSAQPEVVTIGATLAFSSFWLLPRLGGFRRLHPQVQIRVISQDARIHLGGGDVDVVVRFGIPPFDDGVVVASRADEVFPVCSPDYAARLQSLGADLQSAECDLIAQDVPDRSWYGWTDWFERAGSPPKKTQASLRFSNFAEALQAAKAGHGIALGWGALVEQPLSDGTLVRWGDAAITAEGRYNILVPARKKRHPLRDTFVEWLADSLCEA